MTDTLADMLTRIRNALLMRQAQVVVPYSKLKAEVLRVLQREGFIQSFETVGEKTKKQLVLALKYLPDGNPAMTNLKKVSLVSRRVFAGFEALKPIRSGLGVKILSTSKGIFSDAEAREKKIGGEVLVEVW